MVSPDLGVFSRIRTVNDFDRLNQEFAIKKQIAEASLMGAQAKAAKAGSLNVKSLGEQAFVKAAQGLPLTAEETAAARFLDAKSGGMQLDPVTGNAIQKPTLSDKIPLPGMPVPQSMSPSQPQQSPVAPLGGAFRTSGSDFANAMTGGYQPQASGDFLADVAPTSPNSMPPPEEAANEFDIAFEQEMLKAEGNPKLQQQLRADYAKKKYEMTDAEAKAAGFADRMSESNPIIEARTPAGLNPANRAAANIPLIGNIVAGSDYRSFNQAQRDFINAQLRRESGAVINPDEFANAALQYFPQVGDDENVLAQKKANRDAALRAMKRSAGPAYKAPEIKVPVKSQSYKEGTVAENPETGERLMYVKGKWKKL